MSTRFLGSTGLTLQSTTPSTSTSGLPTATGVAVGPPSVNIPSGIAVLTLSSTTLTAYAVPGTTGLAYLENGGQAETLTFRAEGVTLSDGEVVSLGYDGLVVSTATATYSQISSLPLPTAPGPVIFNATTTLPAVSGANSTAATVMGSGSGGGGVLTISSTVPVGGGGSASGTSGGAGGGGSTAAGASGSASASPSTQQNAGSGPSAGRAALALVGAVGGVLAMGL